MDKLDKLNLLINKYFNKLNIERNGSRFKISLLDNSAYVKVYLNKNNIIELNSSDGVSTSFINVDDAIRECMESLVIRVLMSKGMSKYINKLMRYFNDYAN